MGRSIYAFHGLLPPLASIEERYVTIPAGQTLSVLGNSSMRLIFFMGDSVVLLPGGTDKIVLTPGDAVAMTRTKPVRYQSPNPKRDARNHVTILRFARDVFDPGDDNSAGTRTGWFAEPELRLFAGRLTGLRHFPGALDRGGTREILRLIRTQSEKRSDASILKISGLCMALVANLLAQSDDDTPHPAGPIAKSAAVAEHARQYLLEHFRENLTLVQIAWEVRVSGEHLERLFKKHVGATVFEYLDRLRIDHAKYLLLTTDLPVNRIATRCGYSSSNLLCRHFKARTATTPQTFRLRSRSREAFSPSTLNAE